MRTNALRGGHAARTLAANGTLAALEDPYEMAMDIERKYICVCIYTIHLYILIFPLVNVYIALDNYLVQWESSYYKWTVSIAKIYKLPENRLRMGFMMGLMMIHGCLWWMVDRCFLCESSRKSMNLCFEVSKLGPKLPN